MKKNEELFESTLEVVEKVTNIIVVIKDEKNNYIRTLEKEKLELLEEITSSQEQLNGEIYCFNSDKWFKEESNYCEPKTKYTITIYKDITELKKLKEHLGKDCLTQLYNRGLTMELLIDYLKYSNETKEEFAILMIDIDDFKMVNDKYGHLCGDFVLSELSSIVKKATRQIKDTKADVFVREENVPKNRKKDIVGRFGGEEFLVILKNISKEKAIEKAEQIRKQVEETTIEFNDDKIKLTISIGVKIITKEDIESTIKKYKKMTYKPLIEAADIALYQSKSDGKNKVTIYKPEMIITKNTK